MSATHPRAARPRLAWPGEPITVLSLGCGTHSALSAAARDALQNASLLFGAAHHFAQLRAPTTAEKRLFPSPFADLAEQLAANSQQRIVLLASGDALLYGLGSWLLDRLGREHLHFLPNISSVQSCFHHLGLAWQDASVVSLHARPLSSLRRHLQPHALLALLTDNHSTPAAIGTELVQQGFAESRVWVCEALGHPTERIGAFSAVQLSQHTAAFHALNVCVVELCGGSAQQPTFPGIDDAAFSTGAARGAGMLSKRETRLVILAMMQPQRGEVAWDLGAGCGSVSVEWARWNPHGRIYAVEQHAARCEHIRINRARFGAILNLHVVPGVAPACCHTLPPPHCIFIGGSAGQLPTLLDFAWQQLPRGGKLVAAAVTAASRATLAAFCAADADADMVDLAVDIRRAAQTQRRRPVLLVKRTK